MQKRNPHPASDGESDSSDSTDTQQYQDGDVRRRGREEMTSEEGDNSGRADGSGGGEGNAEYEMAQLGNGTAHVGNGQTHFGNGIKPTRNNFTESKPGRLPPIGAPDRDREFQDGVTNTGPEMTKVGVENTGYSDDDIIEIKDPDVITSNGVSSNHDPEAGVDPDVDADPGPALDAPVDFDPKTEPLWYCSFVARRYKLAFALGLGVHLGLVVLSGILVVSGYDLFPTDFGQVPLNLKDDATYLRALAWKYRDADPTLLTANTSASVLGARTKNGDLIQVFYHGGNVLTKERLQAIHDLETRLMGVPNFSDYCKEDISTPAQDCVKPTSLIRFFDGSMDPSLNDMTFSDIPGTLYSALQMANLAPTLEGLLARAAVITPTEAISDVSRSILYTGLPLEGYDLTTDTMEDQLMKIRSFEADNLRSIMYDLLDDGLAGMDINFYSFQLFMYDALKQVVLDMLLAGGSFLFIFLFMVFQTGSVLVTSLAISSILTSFLGANLLYRIVLDFRFFGIFHVLSIFIILGIGADNIFVFYDAWRATAHEKHANLEERLSSCYRRATKSMAITSFTTFAAFVANAFSPLLAINSFGVFSAVLVLVNFLSAVLYFPTVVILYHKKWEDWSWPCFKLCRNLKIYPCARKDPSKTGHRPNAAVRFFRGPYHKVITHRFWRWLFIVTCSAVFAVFVYFATQLKISEKEVQMYRDGHNYQVAASLNSDAFKQNLDDRNVKVTIAFGFKTQDMSHCHKTDSKCHGITVWDESFDLNPKPAQMALLNLCDKIRNLQGHDEMHLQRDPVTRLVDIDCFVSALDNYMVADGNDTSVYTSALDLSLPTSETRFEAFFTAHQNLYNLSVVHANVFYRYFETIKSYWLNNGYRGSYTDDYRTYSVLIGETRDAFDTSEILTNPDQYYATRLRYAAIQIHTSLIYGTKSFRDGLDIYDAWEAWVSDEVKKLPPSLQGGVQFTGEGNNKNAWHIFKVQKVLASSALQGIVIGLCLAFIVLTIATMNIVISVMATLSIVCVVATVTGCIDMFGWKFSVIESVNLSLVVGLSVDYVVHLSESFHSSPHHDRGLKVKDMLENMGVSVVSGAVSTLGASAFMMGAQVQFFFQFGVFIFCSIGFSLLYSLCLYVPMLGLLGPQGHFGSLVPIYRWVKYKIIGRNKEDVDCDKCEGKGFHDKNL